MCGFNFRPPPQFNKTMKPSPECRKPEHLDIVLSEGSRVATGYFEVILECEDGIFRQWPLLFLHEHDLDFSLLKKSISGKPCSEKICPIGKLRQIWKKDI